ncbi:ribokinase [Glaciecola sp. XM2]|uniref:ribokinase n=1 Tax=Glaciecola sp. XM2 TaxID=1914931 RepID=UPI001BDEC086|nr:ribokinase [Glaciecola sp. XM2]MBT1450546.1 ribokinase [Glaciecola sp. XM2]
MAVYNFGSINIDHVYQVPHFVTPGETLSSSDYQSILGGKGANQSVASAKAGIDTFHIGAIHQSDLPMLSAMKDAGVDMSHVSAQTEVASGHAIIQVNPEAENAIFLFPGANHLFNETIIDKALSTATSQDWVLLQNETNAIDKIIEHAFAANVPVAFNPAPMTDSVRQLPLDKITLLIVNEVEAMQLTDCDNVKDAREALLVMSDNTQVLLTLGKKGVCYMHKGQQTQVDAFSVDAVDTTAAGDTFIGYFLANFAQGKPITDALRTACAASAISVTRAGAVPSIPSAMEVDAFLRKHA